MEAGKAPLGSAVPLDVIRDPMHVMPATHPLDTYPGAGLVCGSVSVWEGGMRTFSYVVQEAGAGAGVAQASPDAGVNSTTTSHVPPGDVANPGVDAGPSGSTAGVPVTVKHVFTGNVSGLQAGATELLVEVQKHVPLRRVVGDPGGCFSLFLFFFWADRVFVWSFGRCSFFRPVLFVFCFLWWRG